MDLTVAAAYMETTNQALALNAETSVLVHKNKLMEKEIENLKKYNQEMDELKAEHEQLVAEGERLKAEHERLVAEGEAIAAQGERNRTHKKLRTYYKERHQKYPVEKQRMYHTFLMKTKLKDKIDTMLSGHVIKKSSNETYDLIFSPDKYSKDKPITHALLETKKTPKKG